MIFSLSQSYAVIAKHNLPTHMHLNYRLSQYQWTVVYIALQELPKEAEYHANK